MLESLDEIKMVLYQSGEAKKRMEEEHQVTVLKCRQELQIMCRNICHHLDGGFFVSPPLDMRLIFF